MGEVYRARDTRLDRDVAVKVLPSHLSAAPQLRERFDREARAISRLSHAHVCTLLDVGHQDGIDYLVMEYLDGETLADRLSKGPLPLEQILRYGAEVATALDKAHKQGVVHRDLKPGNVMITRAGAKVLDFGLAKYVGSGADANTVADLPTQHKPLTQEGTLLGTIPYMAPEQLEGAEADPRTDIFALGALLYEMSTGRRAFTGKSRASLIAAIMEHEPPPLSSVAPMTPPALDRVVRTCLAKDPDDRWQSAADVARELKWIADEPQTATPVRRRRANVPLIALATLALAAAAAAIALWMRGGDHRPLVVEIGAPRGYEITYAALSPTGRDIALTVRSDSDPRSRLMIRSLEAEEAVRVEGTEGAVFPFWSPDGKHVGFFTAGKLKTVAVAGGTPQTICDTANLFGTWNKDGTILMGSSSEGLFRVSARGGTPEPATRLDRARRDIRHASPEFLPDGEHFLYYLRNPDPERAGVWLGSLREGAIRRIIGADGNAIYNAGYLLFARRQKLFAQPFELGSMEVSGEPVAVTENLLVHASPRRMTVSAGGGALLVQKADVPPMRQLVWKARDGRELGTAGPVAEINHFSVSPDGRRVVFEQLTEDRTGDLWLLDIGREVVSRLTSDPDWEWAGIWSLDGRRIIFSSSRTDQSDIFEVAINGGEWRPVIAAEGQQVPGVLTPDGKHLLYSASRGSTRGLMLYSVADKRSVPFAWSESFWRHSSALSPDGKWVAYCGVDTGRGEIYVEPFPQTGEKMQITNSGGLRPVWSRDGRELYYLNHDGMLLAVPMAAAAGGLEPGKPVPLFQTDWRNVGDRTYLTPFPDGRFLVIKEVSKRVSGPLRMIVNWTEAIED
jgi:Tol biopolymer transport system component